MISRKLVEEQSAQPGCVGPQVRAAQQPGASDCGRSAVSARRQLQCSIEQRRIQSQPMASPEQNELACVTAAGA